MREPDLVKHYDGHPDWRAWKIDPPDDTGGIRSYLIEAPGVVPTGLWRHYLLGLCHLREQPGVPVPVKQYPGAEYEILLAAIDPDQTVDPDAPPWRLLRPITLTLQFGGVTDTEAESLLRLFTERVVEGQLSPEPNPISTPFMGVNKGDWNALLNSTLACMSDGNHREGE